MFQTHPGFARTMIFKRDHGICAECGMDAAQLERIFEFANHSYMTEKSNQRWSQWHWRRTWVRFGLSDGFLIPLGFTPYQSLWQVDHIIELADGGSHEPYNCQTLCVPCHKGKTANMRTLRAMAKKMARSAIKKVVHDMVRKEMNDDT